MDQARRKILTYLVIAVAFGFSIYFFISPFLDYQDQGQNVIPGFNQNLGTVPTLTSDVDACVINPNLDCDHEMLQIMKFCKDNKDQHIPVCSDVRVPQYVDQRGLERPVISTGR